MDKTKYQDMRDFIDATSEWMEHYNGPAGEVYALRFQAVQSRALVDIAESLAKLTRLADAIQDVFEIGPALIVSKG